MELCLPPSDHVGTMFMYCDSFVMIYLQLILKVPFIIDVIDDDDDDSLAMVFKWAQSHLLNRTRSPLELMFLFFLSFPLTNSLSTNRSSSILQNIATKRSKCDRRQHCSVAMCSRQSTRSSTMGQRWLCTGLWPKHPWIPSLYDGRWCQFGCTQSQDHRSQKRRQWRISMSGKKMIY